MNFNWRQILIVAAVLLAAHLGSAWYYADRYERQVVHTPSTALTLDLSFDEWAAATTGADSSSYLRVAERVAEGKGVVIEVPDGATSHTEPFYYWVPGTPLVLGGWLWLVGGHTMWTFFWFAVAAQLFFGSMAIATARLFTQSTWALAITAFCTGYCPPLQCWFYGHNLTSSEIVSLIPLSLLFFVLSKGFIAYRATPAIAAADGNRPVWRWLRGAVDRWVWLWFALAGLLIGFHSLARDSGAVFATFVACFLVGRALLFDRRRLPLAVAAAAVLALGVYVVRQPVRAWNAERIGSSVVCTSSEGAIWRYGLWMKHDEHKWFIATGIGFGEYLDPEAAPRVEAYYMQGGRWPEWYSFKQLAAGVASRPLDAVAFKTSRLPVLWLGTNRWPESKVTLVSCWSSAAYLILAAFVVVQIRRRRVIPEPLFLYLLLILCASPLIHFEYRYSYPVWNMLVLAPGLLVDSWSSRFSVSAAR